jgi:LmbE family N-acetylglucosaminyl deacetylase
MRTEARTAIFLFAHQDDEFAVFESIRSAIGAGVDVHAWFMTTGVAPHESSGRRNAESAGVLARIGIPADRIVFAGDELGIADRQLGPRAADARDWLERNLARFPGCALHAPVWEGGHPDHDCLCALALMWKGRAGGESSLLHYPLYNGRGLPPPLFRVLSPIAANGIAQSQRIPWRRRLEYLRLLLSYRSQWRSWLGLWPAVAWHYATSGDEKVQAMDAGRLNERPHAGRLYYESRNFARWDDVRAWVGRC